MNPLPPAEGLAPGSDPALIMRIAQLTRLLRDGMRELGLDQAVRDVADAIPDTRDRLRYVARMTEQAANRVLAATESAQPLQQAIQDGARELDQRWAGYQKTHPELLPDMVGETRQYLQDVAGKTQATNAVLLDIMMAQDFQDLTGQVVMRLMDVVGTIEKELLQVLIDAVPQEKREEAEKSLLNGPQIDPSKADVVADQSQVDDLLASLGL
ncbi:MAG: protein phosphatase CheZ [Comamonas sp.]